MTKPTALLANCDEKDALFRAGVGAPKMRMKKLQRNALSRMCAQSVCRR